MKILLIESDAILAAVLKNILARRGHTPVWVQDAASTIHTFGKVLDYFDRAIVIDHGTSIVDGQWLCRQIRRLSPELPIVVVSTDPVLHFSGGCLRAGASAMVKQVDSPEHLLDVVEKVVKAQVPTTN